MKDKVIDFVKNNTFIAAIAGFCVVALGLILFATLGLNEFVVPVCVLIMIEAGMAVLLHNEELWIHGVLLVAQLVTGFIIGRVLLVIVCVVAYVASTMALQFMYKKANGPKA